MLPNNSNNTKSMGNDDDDSAYGECSDICDDDLDGSDDGFVCSV